MLCFCSISIDIGLYNIKGFTPYLTGNRFAWWAPSPIVRNYNRVGRPYCFFDLLDNQWPMFTGNLDFWGVVQFWGKRGLWKTYYASCSIIQATKIIKSALLGQRRHKTGGIYQALSQLASGELVKSSRQLGLLLMHLV